VSPLKKTRIAEILILITYFPQQDDSIIFFIEEK